MKIAVYNAKTKKDVIENVDAIDAALDRINGKATAWTITIADDVSRIARHVEDLLDERELKNELRGNIEVSFTPRGPGAGYNHGAISTKIKLYRAASGIWYLTGVERDTVYGKSPMRRTIKMSEAAIEYIRNKASEAFTKIAA